MPPAICSSASRPPTTPPSNAQRARRRSSRRPTSSCRSSTIRTTSARSPRPTRSPTSTRWAARRSSRWRSSACRSTSSRVETIRPHPRRRRSGLREAGIPIAGGHTIDSVEPIYGLVAIGLVDPRTVKRNAGARPGDALVLGKPLGVGVYSAALKKSQLSAAALRSDDRERHAAQHAGHRARHDGSGARADRRHRLRPRRPSARDLPRVERRR